MKYFKLFEKGTPTLFNNNCRTKYTTQLKPLLLELINVSNYHTVTWCFLWNTEPNLRKRRHKNMTTCETIVVFKYLEGLINRRVTDKMTTAYKDTGKGVAGMEAIKTILDIQASILTLVSQKGYWGGSVCGTMANRAHTPRHTASRRKRH